MELAVVGLYHVAYVGLFHVAYVGLFHVAYVGLYHVARAIFLPPPVEVQNPNHWTAREFPLVVVS